MSKKIKTALYKTCLFLILIGAAAHGFANDRINTTQSISIIKLLATPSLFHNKKVRVTGFMHLEHEGNALYASKEDYEQAILESSIWLSLPTGQHPNFNKRYAVVQGIFKADQQGHFGLFSGAITDIEFIKAKHSRSELLNGNR